MTSQETILIEKVEKALEMIKPYLKIDGGDIRIVKIDKYNNVVVEFLGNCGSCPMSDMTFKAGVEETIKKEVPEINNVYALNIPEPEENNAQIPEDNI